MAQGQKLWNCIRAKLKGSILIILNNILATWPTSALKVEYLFLQTEQEIKQEKGHFAFFGQLSEKRPLGFLCNQSAESPEEMAEFITCWVGSWTGHSAHQPVHSLLHGLGVQHKLCSFPLGLKDFVISCAPCANAKKTPLASERSQISQLRLLTGICFSLFLWLVTWATWAILLSGPSWFPHVKEEAVGLDLVGHESCFPRVRSQFLSTHHSQALHTHECI